MRKLVPILVFAVAATATASGFSGRIPGFRTPVCPLLNSSNTAIGFAGPASGCSASNNLPCQSGEAVAFSAALPSTSSVCGTTTVTWFFGDGSTATGTAVTHTYASAATFTVGATISNSRQTLPLSTAVKVIAAVAPATANRIVNGTFDHDLSHWIGVEALPGGQGMGDVSWSNVDAAGSPNSGSALLRSTSATSRSFQQVQCVALNPGEGYVLGVDARWDGDATGSAIMAVAEFATSDCTGAIGNVPQRLVGFDAPLTWAHAEMSAVASAKTHSGYVFIAAGMKAPGGTQYEVWYDNVFLHGVQ